MITVLYHNRVLVSRKEEILSPSEIFKIDLAGVECKQYIQNAVGKNVKLSVAVTDAQRLETVDGIEYYLIPETNIIGEV